MNQNEITLTLNVNVDTFNIIMAGLDELQHKVSRRVIDSLGKQAQDQIQAQQNATAPATE